MVCNHGDLCASRCSAREGEHFHRGEKEVRRARVNKESRAFQWLSLCWERGIFLFLVGPCYCHRVWEHPLFNYFKLRDYSWTKSFINSKCGHLNNMKNIFLILKCLLFADGRKLEKWVGSFGKKLENKDCLVSILQSVMVALGGTCTRQLLFGRSSKYGNIWSWVLFRQFTFLSDDFKMFSNLLIRLKILF